MAKMTGLGKGLDALFGPAPEEEQVQENDTLKTLKITEVEPNRDQARKRFDQEALEELASSIKEYGLIQPIVVTKKDGYYSIIAGERRWRAYKIAGLTEIPAIIREDNEKINSEISLIENMQREDLNPVEKAMGIKTLIDTYDMSQEEIAKKLGISIDKVREVYKISQDPVSLETPIGEEDDSHLGDFIQDDDSPAPHDSAAYTMLKEQLEEVMNTLTPREAKVLKLRFGLEDGKARTLEEVGREFEVTRERIRQIEAKALRKLRHPSRSKMLRDYMS